MSNYVEQVGGDHYKAPAGQQHWDLMDAYDVDYLAASATGYLTRYDRKGTPRLDLGKARSYLEKIMATREDGAVRRTVPEDAVLAFCKANALSQRQTDWMCDILVEGDKEALLTAVYMIDSTLMELPE